MLLFWLLVGKISFFLPYCPTLVPQADRHINTFAEDLVSASYLSALGNHFMGSLYASIKK